MIKRAFYNYMYGNPTVGALQTYQLQLNGLLLESLDVSFIQGHLDFGKFWEIR